MTPPIKMLENTEVFDAFDEAGGQPLRISAPGRGVLTVTENDPEQIEDETCTEEELEQICNDIREAQNGERRNANEALDELCKKYDL